MGKHFIDPKRSEIMSVFQVFPCTTQIAFFRPKLLSALFLLKSWQKHKIRPYFRSERTQKKKAQRRPGPQILNVPSVHHPEGGSMRWASREMGDDTDRAGRNPSL
jgi:hypothetical protein